LDEVRQKVMLDLFASPGTLIPVVAGASALLLSWAIGGDATANAIGIIGIMGGIGHFASRLVLGLESMTQRAYEAILQRDEKQRKDALDKLEADLRQDKDGRTDACLKQMRNLHDQFQSARAKNRLIANHPQLISRVEEIFDASVLQLQRSLELYELSEKLTGPAKKKALEEREQVIADVLETRDHMNAIIEQFHTFAIRRESSELGRLRSELDETLQVAKRTEERMSAMSGPNPNFDKSEFQ
jgi:hypothetical protein